MAIAVAVKTHSKFRRSVRFWNLGPAIPSVAGAAWLVVYGLLTVHIMRWMIIRGAQWQKEAIVEEFD